MSSNFRLALAGTQLYPITDRHLSGLSHAEQVALLIDSGATLIQLREKTDPAGEFFAHAEQALGVARTRGAKIIINDRVDIALALGADGVHLGQEDLAPDAARRILGDAAIIGFSAHTLEQALLAAQMPVDYVAIGPIFSTATKRSSNPPVGLDGLARVRDALGATSIVAIGGITSENIEATLKAGADAASLIADIWRSVSDASAKTRQLLNLSQAFH
ncbi:MAG TPA: thiamine phosphate synthase [Pyrinomonadaceae bacterium]|jgi:thiamine-phosphate pyrophosphorylase|nr:thiamine phosphate synthase [Pyrinomonadaceae bacterium]